MNHAVLRDVVVVQDTCLAPSFVLAMQNHSQNPYNKDKEIETDEENEAVTIDEIEMDLMME